MELGRINQIYGVLIILLLFVSGLAKPPYPLSSAFAKTPPPVVKFSSLFLVNLNELAKLFVTFYVNY